MQGSASRLEEAGIYRVPLVVHNFCSHNSVINTTSASLNHLSVLTFRCVSFELHILCALCENMEGFDIQ